MNVRRRIAVAVLGLAALGFTAGACGGSSDSSDGGGGASSEQPATAEGLEASARAFADAIAEQNWAEAYSHLSAECQGDATLEEFEVQAEEGMEMAKTFGLDMSKMTIQDVQVRDVTATDGEVLTIAELDGELSDDDEWEPWAYEDGTWRTIDCAMTEGADVTVG